MRRVLLGIGVGAVVLVGIPAGVVAARTAALTSKQIEATPVPVEPVSEAALGRLSTALRFETVSRQDGPIDPHPYDDFRAFLRTSFPALYDRATWHLDLEHTVHVVWPGADPSLPAVLVLAHQDVVPIADPASWSHAPFGGERDASHVWGRGAFDCKGSLMAIHEVADALAREGWQPRRTLHLVFSHDEELGGSGARAVATELAGSPVEAIYDEGLVIADGLVPGIPGRVGLVGVTERGYVTLEVVAAGRDGHSSMPPPEGGTAVAVLARALDRIEQNPLEPSLEGPASLMFDWLAPEMSGAERVVFANRWLFGPVIVGQMKGKASTNASLRTTVAPTMLRASPQENVLASEAVALVNFRLHPRDSVAGIVDWVTSTVDDPRVTVRPLEPGNEPAPIASVESRAFLALQQSYAEVFPGMPVAPGLFIAATDSRWLLGLTSDVYRFTAVPATSEDLPRIHGVDERIATADYAALLAFWRQLLTKQ